MTTPAAESLAALFDAGAASRPGREVAWLERMRCEALETFRAQGIPTTRLEDVKTAKPYVDIALQEIAAGKPVATPVTRAYGCTIKYAM